MKPEQISNSFSSDRNGFSISGVKLADIVKETGTPVYIYDAQTIRRQYNQLRANLPERVEIFYAMKANPLLSVIEILKNLGAGMEIASGGELKRCYNRAIPSEKIAFTGPAKTDEEIKEAVKMGIYSIRAESLGEVNRINNISAQNNRRTEIELRINPLKGIQNAIVKMSGGPSKFGIDEEKMIEAVEYSSGLPNIDLKGVHIFAATGINSREAFLDNVANCFRIASIFNKYSTVRSIGIGGGLSIPYRDSEQELQLSGLRQKLEDMIHQNGFIEKNNAKVILEPGRYLVGQSGIYVSRVMDRKSSRGTKYVLTDGGVHNILRLALIPGTQQPIINLSRSDVHETKFDIGGPICSSLDFLGKEVRLPSNTNEGDYMGVFCAGAYGFTEGMHEFLSHDIPAEVVADSGKYFIARKRKSSEEFLKEQTVLMELK